MIRRVLGTSTNVGHDEINRIILQLSKSKDFKVTLLKLIPNHTIEKGVLKEIEQSLKTNIIIESYFGFDLKELGVRNFPATAEELQLEISQNNVLRSKIKSVIGFINKHKKLTGGVLTLGVVSSYLFAAAENMSGCYKFQVLPKEKLLCKVTSCKNDTDSINDMICIDKKCISDCNSTNCASLSTAKFKYKCVRFYWYDVLAKLTQELEVGKYKLYLKYLLVFIVAILTFNVTQTLDFISRSIITSSASILTYTLVV